MEFIKQELEGGKRKQNYDSEFIAFFLIAVGVLMLLVMASGLVMLCWNSLSGYQALTLFQTFGYISVIALCMLVAGTIKC